jgi:hypothetical protein
MKQIGKVVAVCNKQEGVTNDNEWVNETLVLEVSEGKKMAFEARGKEAVAEIEKLQPGTLVEVIFSIDSREYQGKWYTSLRYKTLA